MPNRSRGYEAWLTETAAAPGGPIISLRQEITDSPAFDWIVNVIQHATAAEIPISVEMLEHAIKVGTRRWQDQDFVDPGISARRSDLVYYIRKDGEIKIGTTTNIVNRMGILRPEALLIVEHGDGAVEAARHDQFAQWQLHGEWFLPAEGLIALISDLTDRFETDFGMPFKRWKVVQDLPTRYW